MIRSSKRETEGKSRIDDSQDETALQAAVSEEAHSRSQRTCRICVAIDSLTKSSRTTKTGAAAHTSGFVAVGAKRMSDARRPTAMLGERTRRANLSLCGVSFGARSQA